MESYRKGAAVFEYKVVSYKLSMFRTRESYAADIEDIVNAASREGWRLFSLVPVSEINLIVITFERPAA